MIEKLKHLLKEAVKKCYENDQFLIEQNMERPAVARIFYYMQNLIDYGDEFFEFREYNLDEEYNKKGVYQKNTKRKKEGTAPDIILHKRQNDNNLLIVEFKSAAGKAAGIRNDIKKLEDFTSSTIEEPDKHYAYQLGVFVKLNHNEADYTYFQDGRQVEEPTANLISGNTNE